MKANLDRVVLAVSVLLMGPIAIAADLGVALPKGTEVQLELLHHVSSGYSSPGSEVFLAVTEDVTVDGRIVVPRGKVVRGALRESTKSKTGGRPGYLSFSVSSINAVDGSEVPLKADFSSFGRDRAKAAGRMSGAFGLAGMFTKGRMAYLEKGARFVATVSEDREIAPLSWSNEEPGITTDPVIVEAELEDDKVALAIEKKRSMGPVELNIESPVSRALTIEELQQVQLVSVNDVRLPQPIAGHAKDNRSRDHDDDGLPEHRIEFDAWDVIRYCNDGVSELVFQGEMHDGSLFLANAKLDVDIRKKAR